MLFSYKPPNITMHHIKVNIVLIFRGYRAESGLHPGHQEEQPDDGLAELRAAVQRSDECRALTGPDHSQTHQEGQGHTRRSKRQKSQWRLYNLLLTDIIKTFFFHFLLFCFNVLI